VEVQVDLMLHQEQREDQVEEDLDHLQEVDQLILEDQVIAHQ
jgi:hypothetical protein